MEINSVDKAEPVYIPHISEAFTPFLPYVEKALLTSNHIPHRILNRRQNLTATIKNWLETCRIAHADHCLVSKLRHGEHTAGPNWLIDVQRNCISPTESGAAYLALSYVWAKDSKQHSNLPDCTTLSNLQELQKPKALKRSKIYLSPTVIQAIRLTRRLQIRYLWVDKLCIVQDDPSTKQAQLDAMAAIYAGSELTIVAANELDETGRLVDIERDFLSRIVKPLLHSKRGPLIPKTLFSYLRFQTQTESFNVERAVRLPENVASSDHHAIMKWYSKQLTLSKWFSRGWTFQENVFPTRKLVFQNDTVNWECHCTSWQEAQGVFNLSSQNQCSQSFRTGAALLNPSFCPDMYRFARLVAIYNLRYLTYPEDAIDTFAGALTDFSRVFEGGFIAAMPVLFSDACLLWQPWGEVTRRIARQSDNAVLPSWSWVGWQGNLNSESWRSAYGYMRANPEEFWESNSRAWFPSSWLTFPTTTWFHSASIIGPKIPIHQLLPVSIAADVQRETYEPPKGWEKKYCHENKMYFYTHERAPEQECWYPIPIGTGQSVSTPVNRSRYLHCRTRRAFFVLGAPFIHKPSSAVLTAMELKHANDDRWAGALRLNILWEDWSQNQHIEGHTEGLCELIELSRGCVRDQVTETPSFDEWMRKECPRKTGLYEFYNVMWIERSNDVAYRKAIGRVQRSSWEEVATEYVGIILG